MEQNKKDFCTSYPYNFFFSCPGTLRGRLVHSRYRTREIL